MSKDWVYACFSLALFISVAIAWWDCRRRKAADSTKSSNETLKLYFRKATWFKQIGCFIILIINIYDMVLYKITHSEASSTLLLAKIVITLCLLACLCIDSHPATSYPLAWCFVYGILSFYEAFTYIMEAEYVHFGGFLVSILPLVLTLIGESRYEVQHYRPTAEYTCTILDFFSFSYLNGILIQPALKKGSLTMEEVPGFCDKDMADINCHKINKILNSAQSSVDAATGKPKLKLVWHLWCLVWEEWFQQGSFQWLASSAVFLSPLSLEKLLIYVKYQGSSEYLDKGFLKHVNIWVIVFLIYLAAVLKSIGDGQNYSRGR
jgi:hypothetical protein